MLLSPTTSFLVVNVFSTLFRQLVLAISGENVFSSKVWSYRCNVLFFITGLGKVLW